MQNSHCPFLVSPTGLAHCGFLRTAIFNYLFAKKNGGTFYLRIEDTDKGRFVPGAEQNFMESLKWAGIEPDESPEKPGSVGPYRQSEREDIYRKYADELIEKGLAYWAFDSTEDVAKAKEKIGDTWNYGIKTRSIMKNSLTLSKEETDKLMNDSNVGKVLRFKVPENVMVEFDDMILGHVSVNSSTIDDKVLIKSDGGATYSLASIVDDHTQGTTHVFRGSEWLPSTPFHILLYKAFGWEHPLFGHLPLILQPTGNKKLSKRDGQKFGFPVMVIGNSEFPGFKDVGFEPDAVFNYFALLGFNPGGDREIYSKEELISLFDISRVSKSGARFNYDKAKWYNAQYLKMKSDDELLVILKEVAKKDGIDIKVYADNELKEIARIGIERSEFRTDIIKSVSYFFNYPAEYDEKAAKKWSKEASAILLKWIDSNEFKNTDWSNNESIHQAILGLVTPEVAIGKIGGSLRLALTAGMPGPELPTIMRLIGKMETYNRIKTTIEKFG